MDSVMRQFMARRRFWFFGRRCRRKEWLSVDQGFIDQWGNFLHRNEAYYIAKQEHQLTGCSAGYEGTLFSEDLY